MNSNDQLALSNNDCPKPIRCLRALEGYLGGRMQLSDKLGVPYGRISTWHTSGTIPGKYVLSLVEAGDNHFKAEDFLTRT